MRGPNGGGDFSISARRAVPSSSESSTGLDQLVTQGVALVDELGQINQNLIG